MSSSLVRLLVVLSCVAVVVAQAPKRKNTLLGRVVTAEREAVANAKVTVRWRLHPELPGLVGWSLPGDELQGVREQVVRADASGRWRVQMPVKGPFELLASSADGKLRSIRKFPVMAGTFVEQVVKPAFLVTGTVRDANGDFAPGFRLRFDPLRSTWTRLMCYGAPLTRGRAVADEAGSFSFVLTSAHVQEPMWAPYLDVMPADDAFHFLRNPLLQPIDACRDLALHAEPSPLHKGFVRDIKGKGIAGARVYVTLEPWRSVVTDKKGGYAIHATRASQLSAAADGFTPQRMPPLEGRKKAGENKLFELVPTRRIRLRLVDGDGAALADHDVLWSFAELNEPPIERRTKTNKLGELTLEDAPLGRTTMGFVRVQGLWCRFLHTVATQNVKLQDRAVVVRPVGGRVVNVESVPLAGVRVVALARDDHLAKDKTTCMWVTYTDHGGRYRFATLPAGRLTIMCEAAAEGFARTDVAPGETRADLQTAATGVVKIRVIDRDLEPVANAWVSLTVPGGIRLLHAPSPTPGQTTTVGFSDAAGNVRFRSLPKGGWQIFAHAIRDGELLTGTARWHPGDPEATVELR